MISTPTPPRARADLHVHSKHSDRPSEWFLRRIGSPESFAEPVEVYRAAKSRGMDYVTISDHNCIKGALEIAHLPETFISNEATTYFPEDGCKVHLLTIGISESQFGVIQELRENIYELRDYLVRQDIVHSLAHPLFQVNDRLTPDHFEKLMLLFNRFEAINGTRHPHACELARRIMENLTSRDIERMADRHGIEPIGPEPWVKQFTAGSDDHSGLYVGHAHTSTPTARSTAAFMAHLRCGDHRPEGEHGTSVQLAHCFYHIGYSYWKHKLEKSGGSGSLVGEFFKRLLTQEPANERPTIRQRLKRGAYRFVRNRKLRRMSEVERTLVGEFTRIFSSPTGAGLLSMPHVPSALSDRQTFLHSCNIVHSVSCAFVRSFEGHARQGRLVDSLQTVAALGPVAMAFAPYLAAFKTQHKDRMLLETIAERFNVKGSAAEGEGRKAWLTDTFTDVNGVAVTIATLAKQAKATGRPLTVMTCLEEAPPAAASIDLVNFKPVGTFRLPEYDQQTLAFPPFLEVIDYLERNEVTELIISTPGPMGLVGMAAGRLLNIPTVGIYHTDFPAYVRHLVDDAAMESLTEQFMKWFYDRMDLVMTPSDAYRRTLVEMGIEGSKIQVMPRGVDLERFRPETRREGYWRARGLGEGPTLLYVGRVSREKNLDSLLEGFERMRAGGVAGEVNLAIVGDGPYLEDLRRRYNDERICYTGYLHGEELAAAYASSDAFVFPSLTDTFGNVVLEAMASGLPVVVSDRGGPADLVGRHGCGLVVPEADPQGMAEAMERLLTEPGLRERLSRSALECARASSWSAAFEEFWRVSPRRVRAAAAKPVHKPRFQMGPRGAMLEVG